MVPFKGNYIPLEELHTHIPASWTGWERSVTGLGRNFTQGLFGQKRDSYSNFPFELHEEGIPKNCWLHEKFAETEARMMPWRRK
jgi:hypothetical protein